MENNNKFTLFILYIIKNNKIIYIYMHLLFYFKHIYTLYIENIYNIDFFIYNNYNCILFCLKFLKYE